MKKHLLLIVCLAMAGSLRAQIYTPTGSPISTAGNFGINVASPQFTLDVEGWGARLRNPGSTSYTTFRLYNNFGTADHAMELAYAGGSMSGPLLWGGPTGEGGSIATVGAFPLAIGTANLPRMVISGAGNIGVGTINPQSQFEVVSGNRVVSFNNSVSGSTGGLLAISRNDGMKTMYFGPSASPTTDNVIYGSGGSAEMRFVSGGYASAGFGFYMNADPATAFSGTRPTAVMRIDGAGNVGIGIGNLTPDAKLAVGGAVHSKEVIVTTNVPGPDYVFEKDYSLPTLTDIESYIGKNKHLPEVPSAKEMEENGVKLGEMNMLLLKKIEELTLYVIELKKENEIQSKEIAELKSKK